MDSKIKTIVFNVTEEEAQDEMIQRIGAIFNTGAVRPEALIKGGEEGFKRVEVNINEDESSSHYTPGSMYQVSAYRRESSFMDYDEGL